MTKMQASIEFLLILSAISLVSVGLVVMYGKEIAIQKSALAGLNTTTISPPEIGSNPSGSPSLSLYMPLNSTIGDQSELQELFYGCKKGTARIALSSNSLELNANSLYINFSNLYITSTSFEPIAAGTDFLLANYTLTCLNKSVSGSKSIYTYAVAASQSYQNSQMDVYISNRNETVAYPLLGATSLFSTYQKNRCTELGFFGGALDMTVQCGTSDGWEYMVFSMNCFTNGGSQTLTYCVLPNPTGYNATPINPDAPSYLYSFQMHITTPYGSFISNVSNSVAYANVISDGKVIGTLHVTNATAQFQPPSEEFLGYNGKYSPLNQSAYSAYFQARQNLYSTLGYYNKSGVSSDIQSEIGQAITSYQNYLSNLISSKPLNTTQCSVSGQKYMCRSPYPFSYVISIKLNGYTGIGNQTIYYLGSAITINES